jgi:hypothetical protein
VNSGGGLVVVTIWKKMKLLISGTFVSATTVNVTPAPSGTSLETEISILISVDEFCPRKTLAGVSEYVKKSVSLLPVIVVLTTTLNRIPSP